MAEILQLSRIPREPPVPSGVPSPVPSETLETRCDEDLMALVRSGSQVAFRLLVVRHAEKVASFCARITGDRVGAREVAQDVWLTLWNGRDRWEARARFASYLYTIAFSRALNHVRSQKRRTAIFASEPIGRNVAATDTREAIDALLERERRERVWCALAELPEAMRQALVLRFVDDLSYDEMALILRTKVPTLRSRVHHALLRLKSHLGEEFRDDLLP